MVTFLYSSKLLLLLKKLSIDRHTSIFLLLLKKLYLDVRWLYNILYLNWICNWRDMIFFTSLRVSVVIMCLMLFLLLMTEVWNKFTSKLTSTGIQFRIEKSEKRKLPNLTICPWTQRARFVLIYVFCYFVFVLLL